MFMNGKQIRTVQKWLWYSWMYKSWGTKENYWDYIQVSNERRPWHQPAQLPSYWWNVISSTETLLCQVNLSL